MSILLNGCTTWMQTKRTEKKLDENYSRMLQIILNKSCKYHMKHQLYDHLAPISRTIQIRRTRHVGHYWKSKDEVISDILQWIPTHERTIVSRPAKTYLQQLCADTGCSFEDLPGAIDDRNRRRERKRERERERFREIRASSVTRWGW